VVADGEGGGGRVVGWGDDAAEDGVDGEAVGLGVDPAAGLGGIVGAVADEDAVEGDGLVVDEEAEGGGWGVEGGEVACEERA
jgi:hypothetical protein